MAAAVSLCDNGETCLVLFHNSLYLINNLTGSFTCFSSLLHTDVITFISCLSLFQFLCFPLKISLKLFWCCNVVETRNRETLLVGAFTTFFFFVKNSGWLWLWFGVIQGILNSFLRLRKKCQNIQMSTQILSYFER